MANPLKGPLAGVERSLVKLQDSLTGDLARLGPIHDELVAIRGLLQQVADELVARREDDEGASGAS